MLNQPNGIPVVGFDPSMNNWGMSRGILVLGEIPSLAIDRLQVSCPVVPENKQVRNNSKDLARAEWHMRHAMAFVEGAQAVFVEVPHGSQSARAMASYGLCVGVLGALRAIGVPFFEVSESEVKAATIPHIKKPTKDDMIRWAMGTYPDAPWPMKSERGMQSVISSKAEHMADSIGAIHAGLRSPSFQQLLPFLKKAA